MIKLKKVSLYLLCLTLALVTLNLTIANFKAKADVTNEEEVQTIVDDCQESIEPYGLYTSLSLSLNGGNGKVWATVKNEITIFPSTVYVLVQLYSSYDYCENISQMNLIVSNEISDLDMGKTIIAEASTNNEEKFWMGRVRYRVDNGGWQEKTVGAIKYSANGEFIGLI